MFLYTELIYRPLLNLLVFLYNNIPGNDLGVAIILLTVLVRLILYPINQKMIVSQRAMQALQPKIEELKEKFKDSREKLGAAMMEMYKKEKVNPFSSCLPLLIQLPILIAVFQVFNNGISGEGFTLLYSGVANPVALNTTAFGFLDLAQRNIVLALMAGIAQYWQTKMLMARQPSRKAAEGFQSAMNKQMLYLMPAMTVVIGSTFPAALALYWLCTTVLSGLQQLLMFRRQEIK